MGTGGGAMMRKWHMPASTGSTSRCRTRQNAPKKAIRLWPSRVVQGDSQGGSGPRGTAKRGAPRMELWREAEEKNISASPHRRRLIIIIIIIRLAAVCASLVQLRGTTAARRALAGPSGPAGIRVGGAGSIRHKPYRESPYRRLGGCRCTSTQDQHFLAMGCSCAGWAGLGRPKAPLRALQGPQGCAWGPGFDSPNEFTQKIPILTRKGRILTRDQHCLTMGCSCAGRAGLGRSKAPLRTLQGPPGCAWGPGFDSPNEFTRKIPILTRKVRILTRDQHCLTAGCSCVGRAGLGRSRASLRAMQDPQGCMGSRVRFIHAFYGTSRFRLIRYLHENDRDPEEE